MNIKDHTACFEFQKQHGDWTAIERRDLIDAVQFALRDVSIVVRTDFSNNTVSLNGADALRLSCPSPLGPVLAMRVDVCHTDALLAAIQHEDSSEKTATPRIDAFFEAIHAWVQPDPAKRAATHREVDAKLVAKNHDRFFKSLLAAVTESLKDAIPAALALSNVPPHRLVHEGRDIEPSHRVRAARGP